MILKEEWLWFIKVWKNSHWIKKTLVIWGLSIGFPLINIYYKIFIFSETWDSVQSLIQKFSPSGDGVIFLIFAIYNLIALGFLFYFLNKKETWKDGVFIGLFISFIIGNTLGYLEFWQGFLSESPPFYFGLGTFIGMLFGAFSLVITFPLGLIVNKIKQKKFS